MNCTMQQPAYRRRTTNDLNIDKCRTELKNIQMRRRSDNNSKLHNTTVAPVPPSSSVTAPSMNTTSATFMNTTSATSTLPCHPAITPRLPMGAGKGSAFNATLNDSVKTSTISSPIAGQVDLLISEANEITKCLHKNYVFSRYTGSRVSSEPLIKIVNTRLGQSCVWPLVKLKERLIKMRRLMHTESQEICSGRSAYGDSQDEWSKANDSFHRGDSSHSVHSDTGSLPRPKVRSSSVGSVFTTAADFLSTSHRCRGDCLVDCMLVDCESIRSTLTRLVREHRSHENNGSRCGDSRHCFRLVVAMETLVKLSAVYTAEDKKLGRHLMKSTSRLADEVTRFLKVCDSHQASDIAEWATRCIEHVYEVASDIGELYTGHGYLARCPTATTTPASTAATTTATTTSATFTSPTAATIDGNTINSLDNHDSNSYYPKTDIKKAVLDGQRIRLARCLRSTAASIKEIINHFQAYNIHSKTSNCLHSSLIQLLNCCHQLIEYTQHLQENTVIDNQGKDTRTVFNLTHQFIDNSKSLVANIENLRKTFENYFNDEQIQLSAKLLRCAQLVQSNCLSFGAWIEYRTSDKEKIEMIQNEIQSLVDSVMQCSLGDPLGDPIADPLADDVAGEESLRRDRKVHHVDYTESRIQRGDDLTSHYNGERDACSPRKPTEKRGHANDAYNCRGYSSGRVAGPHATREPRGHSTPVEESLPAGVDAWDSRVYSDRIPRGNTSNDVNEHVDQRGMGGDIGRGGGGEFAHYEDTTCLQINRPTQADQDSALRVNGYSRAGVNARRSSVATSEPEHQYYNTIPRGQRRSSVKSTCGSTSSRNSRIVDCEQPMKSMYPATSAPLTSTYQRTQCRTNGDLDNPVSAFEPIHPADNSARTSSTSIRSPLTSVCAVNSHDPTIHAATNFADHSPRNPLRDPTFKSNASANQLRQLSTNNNDDNKNNLLNEMTTPRMQPGNYNTLPKPFRHRQNSCMVVSPPQAASNAPTANAPTAAPRTKRILPATPPGAATNASTPPGRGRCHSARVQHLAAFTTKLKQYSQDHP